MSENFLIKTDDTSSYYHTISSYENEENKKKKNKGKRQFSEVWQYIKYDKEKSSGNYKRICTFCGEFWNSAKPAKLKIHLAKSYSKCPEDVQRRFINLILTEKNKNKKVKTDKLKKITHNFEKAKVNKLKSNKIDNALIKAFICCNIAFTIVKNPFFIELLKTLCLGYDSS